MIETEKKYDSYKDIEIDDYTTIGELEEQKRKQIIQGVVSFVGGAASAILAANNFEQIDAFDPGLFILSGGALIQSLNQFFKAGIKQGRINEQIKEELENRGS